MRLVYEKFISPKELSEFVAKNGIGKDSIQSIVFDCTYGKFILFYWSL